MATILTESQRVLLTVSFQTSSGKPATVDGPPQWSSSDESVVMISNVSMDGMTAYAVAVGSAGVSKVTASGDADLGPGERLIEPVIDIEVEEVEAQSATISAGFPEPK